MNTSHSLANHQLTPPDFSIITIHNGTGEPPDQLFCAAASIADQEAIKSEQVLPHTAGVSGLWNKISKELQSSKRTQRYTLRLLEEKNTLFNDALQRAIARASGTFIGFLQPHEQYLPGALVAVEKYFQAHPETDLLFTGAWLHEEKNNKFIPFPATALSLEYLWTAHPRLFPSTLFVRATLLKKDFPIDPSQHEGLFQEWLLRLLRAGKKIEALPIITTLSAMTPSEVLTASLPAAPIFMKLLKPWWKARHTAAAKKAKRRVATTGTCLAYKLGSLSQRIDVARD